MNHISRTNDPSTDAVPVAASSVGGSRRLSDSERATALDALGTHLSEGRIDVAEFDDRSAIVAGATRESDLHPAFEGLGGLPAALAPKESPDAELERIRSRGRVVENIDWIGVALAIGLGALFMATGWAPPGFALLALAVCSIGGRIVFDFDEDTEYEALKKADRRKHLDRIEGARDPGAGV
ncbi:hypothetical protein CJ204_05540 [Corynebacterium xerosis]|uniref:DUF1707 domain-containing protein n=1 Tax=Corynebacterium xerosis TaxID=1725 RepID=A0A2N6SZH4_9CORY|nr:DUF1707 domain-containing protein [Corynebacterium xerosis]PMC62460.1 hypothetical protein CJ204_05540 [Corynebacterium xerosis]